jgi:hypothetical protein
MRPGGRGRRAIRRGSTVSASPCSVEAIGTCSNKVSLGEKSDDLRKRVQESPPRSHPSSPPPRSKRFLRPDDLADIAASYQAGATTEQIGNRRGISKIRVATVLGEQGISIRRQGLAEEQAAEAATLYVCQRHVKTDPLAAFEN